MNMQNKLYKMQFFSPLDDRFTSSPQVVVAEPGNCEFRGFCEISEKDQAPGRLELLDQRGFEHMEARKKKKDSCPLANPHS